MKKYEKTKGSGIEWLGEVPSHWQAKSINVISNYLSRGNAPDYNDEGEIYAVNQATFSSGQFKKSKAKPSGGIEVYKTMKGRLFPGDILLASTGGGVLGKVCHFLETDRQYFADSHVTIIRPTPDIVGRFVYYFLSVSYDLINGILAQGSTNQTELQSAWLKRFKWAFPPLPEQRAIAAYLDHKTAQLDTLLAQKETLLQKLHQKRQALINEAVTQGLDPAAPRKPSGVAWLGDVPAHWEVKRMKNICSVRQGLQIPIEDRYTEPFEGAFEYITIKSINNPNSPKEYIKSPSLRVICDYDDILMARTGATAEVVRGVKGAFHNNFFLVDYDRNQVRKEFLYYYLTNSSVKNYLKLMAGTTTIPDLNHGEFYSTPFLHPPAEEQEAIETYINSKCQEFDKVNGLLTKQIKTLKAYRQSLISEVVTGKVDVRPAVLAPEADLPLWMQ
jgi:type I restriction enzyme S subunit